MSVSGVRMSEPLSSVEIEDVLSSIRRLVSEDLRPMTRGPAVTPVETPKQALILTPALRVVSSTPATEPASPAIEAVMASVAAGITAQAPEFEPELGDAVPQPATDRTWDGTDWQAEGEAETSEAVGGTEHHLRVDEAGEVFGEAASDEAFPDLAGPASDVSAEPGWAQSGGEDAAFAGDAPHSAPETREAASEAGWVDEAEAEVIAGLIRTQQDEPAVNLLDDAPELTFDEEVLRDLVRDLIREELQGHLGERITRNIRKLVRAEIARALAAAELN